ncbi:MAG: hypothetical protein R6U98_34095, partial [Pirellulaceae bacterium]
PFGIDSSFAIACPQWSGNNGYICLARGYVDPETVDRYMETREKHVLGLLGGWSHGPLPRSNGKSS